MEKNVELFAAVYFVVVGLSHLLQPMAWVEFFAELRARGRSGAFFEGFLSLGLGAFIVAFHDVWSGLPAVLTVVGALLVLKAAVRFCAPELALRVYANMTPARAWRFRAGGAMAIALGIVFAYTWSAR